MTRTTFEGARPGVPGADAAELDAGDLTAVIPTR